MICREVPELELLDGSHTIILSTCGENDSEVSGELVKFLEFVGAGLDESNEDYADDYVSRLQTSVAHVKTNREMEKRYMLWKEFIKEERDEAREEGRMEERMEVLLEVLNDLPGDISADLEECIRNTTDLDKLRMYTRKACKAASIDEFAEMIKS